MTAPPPQDEPDRETSTSAEDTGGSVPTSVPPPDTHQVISSALDPKSSGEGSRVESDAHSDPTRSPDQYSDPTGPWADSTQVVPPGTAKPPPAPTEASQGPGSGGFPAPQGPPSSGFPPRQGPGQQGGGWGSPPQGPGQQGGGWGPPPQGQPGPPPQYGQQPGYGQPPPPPSWGATPPRGFPPPGQQGYPPPGQQPQWGGQPGPPAQYGQQPYGGQPGYGAPPGQPRSGDPYPQQYGQPPYGQQPHGPAGYGQVPGPLADWGTRALSFLIDAIAPVVVLFVLILLAGLIDPTLAAVVYGLGILGILAFTIWNSGYKQGTTGQSIGKGVAKTRLVGTQTGQPIGFGMAFLRQLAHIVDGLPCYLGYLWPLWDERRQTFADKIMDTVVVRVGQ